MPEIILIRGVPGSGKSTLAKTEFPDHKHFEADMFFMKDGVYSYDPKQIKQAHKWCQERALEALNNGENVVVSNTFIKLWEMKIYMDMGFPFIVNQAVGEYPNSHNVDGETVKKMRERFEPYNQFVTKR